MGARVLMVWAGAAMLVATAVHAAPVVTYDGGTGYATGIKNLAVNTDIFDVDFIGGAYDDVYAADAPYFLDNEPGAGAAADAIMNVLNGEPTVPEIAAGDSEILWVPYSVDAGSFKTEQRGHNDDADPWQMLGDFMGSTGMDHSGQPNSWLFTRFAVVPEPSSVAFLGIGALAIAGRRRK